jgi:Ser/Thr protein kinase RdoA (MazF antagonist)
MSSDRKFKVHSIDLELGQKLIAEFDSDFEIESIERSLQGKSSSNYVIKQKGSHERLLLRILPQNDISCRKELGIYHFLNEYIPIPEIYFTNETCKIIDKPYQIAEFIEGITLAEHILQGREVSMELIAEVAEKSALIHRSTYDKEGSLNAQLEIVDELPPILNWHEFFLERLAGERLGIVLKCELKDYLDKNKDEFQEVCSYFVLSHGDFRPDNIMVLDGKLQAIIDWENALSAPIYFDTGQFFRYGELLPRKAERIYAEAYNSSALKPLDRSWRHKSRLMDCVNLLCLLELPHIGEEWQNELKRKIKLNIV